MFSLNMIQISANKFFLEKKGVLVFCTYDANVAIVARKDDELWRRQAR